MPKFHKLKVKSILKETEKAVSVAFDVPQELKDEFSFKAGQYIILKTNINDTEVRRDYSLCTNPSSSNLKVVVKEVEGGLFSTFANNQLQEGDYLEVSPAKGRFVFEPSSDLPDRIVAFAAGSGITPIMSIIKTGLEETPQKEFVLVYGNKTPLDTIFLEQLRTLENEYGDRFKLFWTFSQSNESDALFGRIDGSIVNFVSNKIGGLDASALYYLCGPKEMIEVVSNTLKEKDIPKEQIKFELFTNAPDEDYESNTIQSDGNTEVTVVVDDETSTFTMSQDKTILEVALENKIDAPYSCQGGICSSCIARITEGEATMRQNNILTDGELEEGLILTCQAQPTTPTISIDYDDV